jgi:glutamine synthetase
LSPKLDELSDSLKNEFALDAVMAAEIECYVMLADESEAAMDSFWKPVDAAFRAEQLPILRIEKERGLHQYEVITTVTTPQNLATALTRIRALIERQGKVMKVKTSFAAKPFPDQPSSGLHLHLHLADGEGINAFHKTEEWTSDALRFSIGGLLNTLNDNLAVFFPNPEDYARLEDVDHVPKIAGWGVNNRYCALRIPADPDPYSKRIEHRVPCANADPTAAIEAMLSGVLRGLREKIEPPVQSYGKRVAAA